MAGRASKREAMASTTTTREASSDRRMAAERQNSTLRERTERRMAVEAVNRNTPCCMEGRTAMRLVPAVMAAKLGN